MTERGGASRSRTTLQNGWQIASGQQGLLALRKDLIALAARYGQAGTVERMDYFLTAPYPGLSESFALPLFTRLARGQLPLARSKVPKILFRTGPAGLEAAVLLLEYWAFGVCLGFYSPVDGDNHRTVIAPPGQRAEVAREVAELLLEQGGRFVVVSYVEEPASSSDDPPDSGFWNTPHLLATRPRDSSHLLPLLDTFEATLAQMGAHTRRNLRAYQRRVVQQLNATYQHEVELSLDDVLELNRSSAFTAPDWLTEWRYQSAKELEGGFVAGLRGGDGRWLSLAGGYMQASTGICYLDWQMNRSGLESFSLVSAMRAFLIADQIEQGSRWMDFEGGTPHSIRSAFRPETTRDLLFARRALWPSLLRQLGSRLSIHGPMMNTLRSPKLTWRP